MMHRAYVQQSMARFGVDVYLTASRDQNGDRIALAQPIELVFADVDPNIGGQMPTLQLPEDAARALLDALAAHFGGVSEVQTLRKDYMAERARVDKLIDHMTKAVSS